MRRNRSSRCFVRWLLAGTIAAGSGANAQKPEQPAPASAALRVLFVGNSYIYTNGLPAVVERIAAAHGRTLVAGMLAEPNYAIEDHLAEHAYATMLEQGWDWVVLQQGPSSLPENQVNLRVYSGQAAALARAHGSRVALMSAWPALQNLHTWSEAERSYHDAAVANGLCVLPVATAWRYSRDGAPGIELYQSDQLHPEREGTLLAAEVIAQGLIEQRRYGDAPALEPWIPQPDWRGALQHAATLDAFARRALATEWPRCRSAKTQRTDPAR